MKDMDNSQKDVVLGYYAILIVLRHGKGYLFEKASFLDLIFASNKKLKGFDWLILFIDLSQI